MKKSGQTDEGPLLGNLGSGICVALQNGCVVQGAVSLIEILTP